MLTETELQAIFEERKTSPLGQARVRFIRDNLPSRAVAANAVSHAVRYIPRKMPFVIEGEAWSTEGARFVELDYDDDALEYYPQPAPLKITFTNRAGRSQTLFTTPDIFIVRRHRFVFEECKTEEELINLAQQFPDRYTVDASGRWRSPPAEKAAAIFGCEFELHSSAQNNWALIENLELLKDYWRDSVPPVPEEDRRLVIAKLRASSYVTGFELIHEEPRIPADSVFALVANREIWVDLFRTRLADLEHAYFFRDELSCSAYRVMTDAKSAFSTTSAFLLDLNVLDLIVWDGKPWKVLNLGEKSVALSHSNDDAAEDILAELTWPQLEGLAKAGKVVPLITPDTSVGEEAHERLRKATPKQLQIASWKYQLLFGTTDDRPNPLASRRQRSRAYWMAAWRKSEVSSGFGFAGLLPQHKGNSTPQVEATSLSLMLATIEEDWETIRQKQIAASYGKYVNLCPAATPVASYRTFTAHVRKRRCHEQSLARLGRKAAYVDEPQYLELEYTTPRHGVRPLHIAHIDHTSIPLVLLDKTLTRTVKSLWASVLIDAYSRKILAFYFSFDPPSYRSNMMVLRDCVRRHGRAPQWIVSDGGSDFRSVYYETLLGRLHCNKKSRRTSKSRDGSIIERFFKTTKEQFILTLLGSTKIYEHYRQVSPEVDPERHAIWTMERFAVRFEAYIESVYHENEHSTLGMSPNQMFALGLVSYGQRRHILVSYNGDFIALTCPSTAKGTAKVGPRGVKINYLYYSCPEFRLPGVAGTDLAVRYDPFNMGRAYAYVNGAWHECRSEYFSVFSQYSERAIQIASQRLLLKQRRAGKALVVNAQRLAEFLASSEADEALELQRLHDGESTAHRSSIVTPQDAAQSARVDDAALPEVDVPNPTAPELSVLEDL